MANRIVPTNEQIFFLCQTDSNEPAFLGGAASNLMTCDLLFSISPNSLLLYIVRYNGSNMYDLKRISLLKKIDELFRAVIVHIYHDNIPYR